MKKYQKITQMHSKYDDHKKNKMLSVSNTVKSFNFGGANVHGLCFFFHICWDAILWMRQFLFSGGKLNRL